MPSLWCVLLRILLFQVKLKIGVQRCTLFKRRALLNELHVFRHSLPVYALSIFAICGNLSSQVACLCSPQDVFMPVMDGHEASKRIIANGTASLLAFLVQTSLSFAMFSALYSALCAPRCPLSNCLRPHMRRVHGPHHRPYCQRDARRSQCLPRGLYTILHYYTY
jgi:hypothetical protein